MILKQLHTFPISSHYHFQALHMKTFSPLAGSPKKGKFIFGTWGWCLVAQWYRQLRISWQNILKDQHYCTTEMPTQSIYARSDLWLGCNHQDRSENPSYSDQTIWSGWKSNWVSAFWHSTTHLMIHYYLPHQLLWVLHHPIWTITLPRKHCSPLLLIQINSMWIQHAKANS